MSRPLLTLVVVLLLPAAAHSADPMPGPAITLPDVEGFTRDQPLVYKEKGLGYSVGYKREGMTVTVYVYNQNRPRIAAGPESDAVKAEMLDSISGVEGNKTTGTYKTISPTAEKVVSLGTGEKPPQFRWKQYEVALKDDRAFTELYLTGYKDHFVKMRVTYFAENAAASRKAIQLLLDAVGDALE
ncbi:MAG: hypothetical protein JWO38_3479 [Gemmataceae bacterium]|nr:hypothetical protein [Gemmataceae bacterium]